MHSSAHSEGVRHVPTISASLFFFNFPQAPSIVHHFCRPSAVTELHALYSRDGDHDRQSVFETSAGRLSICGLERSLKSHDVYRIPPRWVTGRGKNGHVMDFREAEVALKKAGKNPRCFSAGSLTQWLKRLFLVFRFLFLVTDPSYQEHLHLQSSSSSPHPYQHLRPSSLASCLIIFCTRSSLSSSAVPIRSPAKKLRG